MKIIIEKALARQESKKNEDIERILQKRLKRSMIKKNELSLRNKAGYT